MSIVIGIHAIEELVNLFLRKCEIITLQARSEFVLADVSAVVLVKVGEGRTQVVFLQVVVALETGRNELGIIDKSVLI